MNPVTFDESTHTYTDDAGQVIPSVTQILKALGLSPSWWASEEHRQRGQAVHKACRLVYERRWDPATTHEKVVPFARGFQRFLDDRGVFLYESTAWETPLASSYGFAGTPDTWGRLPEKAAGDILLDFKSGTCPRSVGLQLSAYRMLIKENYPGTDLRFLRAVQLNEDSTYVNFTGMSVKGHGFVPFEARVWEDWWISCLNVYRLRQAFGVKEELEAAS